MEFQILNLIAYFWIILIAFIIWRQWKMRRNIYSKFLDAAPDARKILLGKTVIITGANVGIGRATNLDLAKRGARVIMACRDEDTGLSAATSITHEIMDEWFSDKTRYSDEFTYPCLIAHKCDLSDFRSIRSFAQKMMETESRLDILINNGGVMSTRRLKTAQGHEEHFGINHLGHMYLTLLLLPLLNATAQKNMIAYTKYESKNVKKSSDDLAESNDDDTNQNPSRCPMFAESPEEKLKSRFYALPNFQETNLKPRIVTVSSFVHKGGEIDFTDLHFERREFRYMKAYATSKLANILFTKELARRLKTGKGLERYLKTTQPMRANDDLIKESLFDSIQEHPPYNITSIVMHPGIVVTNLSKNIQVKLAKLRELYVKIGTLVFQNTFQGCQTILYCALAPELEDMGGYYYGDCSLEKSSPASRDPNLAQELWAYSMKCIEDFENSNSGGIDNLTVTSSSSSAHEKMVENNNNVVKNKTV